jgi:hypothetical protein
MLKKRRPRMIPELVTKKGRWQRAVLVTRTWPRWSLHQYGSEVCLLTPTPCTVSDAQLINSKYLLNQEQT